MAGKMEGDDSSDEDRSKPKAIGAKRIEAEIHKKVKGILTDGRL
jgi:hypothetical protein